jgi:hypothetical protein
VSETITFDKTHFYSTLKPGISLTAILRHGQESVECEAKLDTGSSHCIFRRSHGELLGLDIESAAAEKCLDRHRSFLGSSSPDHNRGLGHSFRSNSLFCGGRTFQAKYLAEQAGSTALNWA